MRAIASERTKEALREIRDAQFGRANLSSETVRELIEAGAINYGWYRGEYDLTQMGKAMASVL